MCKQSVPCSRQITTPTPHRSTFAGPMLFLTPDQQCQSTEGIIKAPSVIASRAGLTAAGAQNSTAYPELNPIAM